MTATAYRYHLPVKAIKSDCPACGPRHRRTLSRYIDSHTGEPIGETFGRCDRESNCGYHLSPYTKDASGKSYADAVYGEWKAANLPSVEVDAVRLRKSRRQPTVENNAGAEQPVFTIPYEVFRKSLDQYDRNQFAQLLIDQFGETKALELLQRFQIGTSVRWPGACVFWLKDERHRVRAGQVVLFAKDWHKARFIDREGHQKVCITSVSHSLMRQYRKQQLMPPDWLINYHQNAPRWPILFGLHQLADAPADQPIALAEAPKTAVVCSAMLPAFVWLAVGALSYLNAERLAPLKGRKVVLFPDLSKNGTAFARWSAIAGELNTKGFQISVWDYLERHATEEDKTMGLDLADYLLTDLHPRSSNFLPKTGWTLSFPVPQCWDTIKQLNRIRWCVLPHDEVEINPKQEVLTDPIF